MASFPLSELNNSFLGSKKRLEFAIISSSFCRYQPFGEPLLAVNFTAISRSANRYYLFGEVLLALLAPLFVCTEI